MEVASPQEAVSRPSLRCPARAGRPSGPLGRGKRRMQAAAPERRAGKASMGEPDWRRHPAQSAWLAVWPRFVMSPTHTNRMHVPQAGPFRTTAAHHCWHDGSNICFAAKHSPRPQGSNTHWAAMAAAKRTTKVASLSKAKPTPAQAAAPASNGGAPAASGFFRREPAAASLSSKAGERAPSPWPQTTRIGADMACRLRHCCPRGQFWLARRACERSAGSPESCAATQQLRPPCRHP